MLDDLARRGGADLVINLGDCVSGPLWPRETVERLEALDCRPCAAIMTAASRSTRWTKWARPTVSPMTG